MTRILLILLLPVSGCALKNPHENFDVILQGAIGRNLIEEDKSWRFGYREELVKTIVLESGNIEHYYQQRSGAGECIHVLEVEPKTNIIRAARRVSDRDACWIVP